MREQFKNNRTKLSIIKDKDRGGRVLTSICIFGFCEIGIIIYELLQKELNDVTICFCDNDSAKQGIQGQYTICSVEEAAKNDCVFVLGSLNYQDSMTKQLGEMGVQASRILDIEYRPIQDNLVRKRAKEKYYPLKQIRFEVDLAEHCNLNCKCCSQFSQISKEVYYDLGQYEKDIQRMSEIFSGNAERIYLIGGEPLLNNSINLFIEVTRRAFRRADISVFTNGILLKTMSKNFWKTVKENEVGIIVTKYPIDIDYESIEKLASEHGVRCEFFKASKDFKYMRKIPLDLHGEQDANESFILCEESNNCIKLKDGKLYTCTRPAAIHKFNEYFGKNLEVSKDDYIDIYSPKTAEEIFEELAKPIPFCRYCIKSGKMQDFDWGISEKTIREYI